MIVTACGSVGFKTALDSKRDEYGLEQLVGILDFMYSELQYRGTPLPSLCNQVANNFKNMPGQIFKELSKKMESQLSSNISQCMSSALSENQAIPQITRTQMIHLGNSMGRFDLDGQLRGLEAVKQDCMRNLEQMRNKRDERLRGYQTLGLCAGAALVILFI